MAWTRSLPAYPMTSLCHSLPSQPLMLPPPLLASAWPPCPHHSGFSHPLLSLSPFHLTLTWLGDKWSTSGVVSDWSLTSMPCPSAPLLQNASFSNSSVSDVFCPPHPAGPPLSLHISNILLSTDNRVRVHREWKCDHTQVTSTPSNFTNLSASGYSSQLFYEIYLNN